MSSLVGWLAPPSRPVLVATVTRALEEDVAGGDLTTNACVPPGLVSEARVVARQEMVTSGLVVLAEVFRQCGAAPLIKARADGIRVAVGEVLAEVEGEARVLLTAERVALNFVQHLSGIATLTRRFVDALAPRSKTRVVDTRKTTPGLRALERYAVRCGGGHNHRGDLGSGVLIKDNHIAAAGGLRVAVERARTATPHTCRIECEVDSFSLLEEALEAHVDIVLLDNFSDDMVEAALGRIAGRAVVEVSGNVHLDRVRHLSQLGVDFISVGALTHSAPAADVGFDWAL